VQAIVPPIKFRTLWDKWEVQVSRCESNNPADLTKMRSNDSREMDLQIIRTRNTESTILARLIQSRTEIDSHVAQYLLSLDFEPEDVDRMNLLAARSRDGEISPEEEAELDSYLHVGNLLAIMQSKARVFLRTQKVSPSPQ